MRQSRPTDNTFASDLYAVQIHTCTRISEMCFSNSGPASNIFKLTLEFTLSNERFEIHRGAVPRKLLFIYFFFLCATGCIALRKLYRRCTMNIRPSTRPIQSRLCPSPPNRPLLFPAGIQWARFLKKKETGARAIWKFVEETGEQVTWWLAYKSLTAAVPPSWMAEESKKNLKNAAH